MTNLMKECEKQLKYYGLGDWYFEINQFSDCNKKVEFILKKQFNPNDEDITTVPYQLINGIFSCEYMRAIKEYHKKEIDSLNEKVLDLEKYKLFYDMYKDLKK